MHLSKNTKRRLGFYGSLLSAIAGFALYCSAMPGRSFHGAPPPPSEREVRYEARARADVQALASSIGERSTVFPGRLHAAADYVEAQLREAGLDVHRHPYDVVGERCETLDVDVVGTTSPRAIVLLGAHYDSASSAPGADDNASGVAGVLALARAFAHRPMRATLRFALFPNEEPPYFARAMMGSRIYALELKARGDDVIAMLSLESIGYFSSAPGSQKYPGIVSALYPDRGDFIAFVGDLGARGLVREAIGAFRAHATIGSEGGALPRAIPGVDWSDHRSFRAVGYPAIMVTDTAPFRNPSYHKPSDTAETLDYAQLARVIAGVEDVVTALASR